ncbi:MAG: restriction endonuclease subunit S, partial [Romboutsia timonensis]|uniref:restriction endonuclease subunit S n=1 Tax=Romboutsia timonensis TaxID=1776391 RepID=UPI002A751B88
GSGQPNLSPNLIGLVKIPLPPLEEQEKIADVLSSLDNKIELNNEMNKTLEEMAQSIFKRWFVDFEFPNEDGQSYKSSGGEMVESELGMIPKGWEVKELGEVININPRESLKKGEEKIYVEMANLPLNYARITNYIEKPFNGGTKFRNGDTLLARITPCLENGKTAIVDFLEENDLAFGSTEYIVMRPKVLNQYYIYCLSRNEDFRNYAIKNMNGSSGRQRVDANTIKQYRIPCPDENTLELYNQFCVSLFNQMKKNDDESKVLGDIRDTLLPKLMSGDIK